MSPLQVYNAMLARGEIKADDLQQQVVNAFEDLYHKLKKNHSQNQKRYWFFRKKPVFHGLYIFGEVGRGKTFLMDLFVSSMSSQKIKRQHFHEFMLWLHAALHQIKGQQNPIDLIIKDLSQHISVLCLDEFLVHDITDAMLLANILYAMQQHGISLITTSNVNPKDLYYGGLQRKKFLPAIAWMQKNMQIMQLDGDYDHRSSALNNKQNNWLSPINEQTKTLFEQKFSEICANHNIHLAPIIINKREIAVVKYSNNCIMFEFDALCKQARNASDYLKICQQYDTIFIVINAAIEKNDRNTAKRFINLIDVLYDNNNRLYVLSQVDFKQLYQGEDYAFEIKRTISRLRSL